jgi:hypothetical protein
MDPSWTHISRVSVLDSSTTKMNFSAHTLLRLALQSQTRPDTAARRARLSQTPSDKMPAFAKTARRHGVARHCHGLMHHASRDLDPSEKGEPERRAACAGAEHIKMLPRATS